MPNNAIVAGSGTVVDDQPNSVVPSIVSILNDQLPTVSSNPVADSVPEPVIPSVLAFCALTVKLVAAKLYVMPPKVNVQSGSTPVEGLNVKSLIVTRVNIGIDAKSPVPPKTPPGDVKSIAVARSNVVALVPSVGVAPPPLMTTPPVIGTALAAPHPKRSRTLAVIVKRLFLVINRTGTFPLQLS